MSHASEGDGAAYCRRRSRDVYQQIDTEISLPCKCAWAELLEAEEHSKSMRVCMPAENCVHAQFVRCLFLTPVAHAISQRIIALWSGFGHKGQRMWTLVVSRGSREAASLHLVMHGRYRRIRSARLNLDCCDLDFVCAQCTHTLVGGQYVQMKKHSTYIIFSRVAAATCASKGGKKLVPPSIITHSAFH
jgi:hypothetical protein